MAVPTTKVFFSAGRTYTDKYLQKTVFLRDQCTENILATLQKSRDGENFEAAQRLFLQKNSGKTSFPAHFVRHL
jgi:hypothetical protein